MTPSKKYGIINYRRKRSDFEMKRNPNKGYKNDWINLSMDGISHIRRIKNKEKKMMKNLTKQRLKKDFQLELLLSET